MADVDLHSDDISGLWKSERDDVLTPVIPATTAGDPESVMPAPVTNGNGSRNGHANTTRLTRVEEKTSDDVARLAAALDGHQRAIRSELQSLREQCGGPVDGLAAFRREMRHEVARLSDLVAAQARESAQQSAVERERRERHDDWVMKAASDVSAASRALAAISEDLASLRSEVAELRGVVNRGCQNERKPFRRGRSR